MVALFRFSKPIATSIMGLAATFSTAVEPICSISILNSTNTFSMADLVSS